MLEPGIILRGKSKYKVLNYFNSGGCSDLYLGLDTIYKRKVLLKIFNKRRLKDDLEIRRYHLRESAFIDIQSSYCSYTQKLLDRFIDKEYLEYVLVTNFIEGCDFEDWFQNLLESPPNNLYGYLVQNIFLPLSDYFAYVHSHGILHRDFTPYNLLITEYHTGYRPVVIDWGASINFDPALLFKKPQLLSGMNKSKEDPIYTPGFEPPELNLGYDCIPQSDIYYFGEIMYYALTKGHFRKRTRSILTYVLHPQYLNDQCPAELCKIVEKCTQYEPRDRYLTFEHLRADLLKFTERISI